MLVRRISPAVVAYVAVAVAQMAVVLIVGGGGVSIAAVVLAACLFTLLSMGQALAWWILLAFNSIGLIALLVTTGADLDSSAKHVLWAHVVILVATTLAMELALLSPGMRLHVATRGMRLAPRSHTDARRT